MTILTSLKEETRPLHDKLESELDLLRSDFSITDYINTLKKFYGFHQPLEPLLHLATERLKVPKLEDDLRFFGVKNLEDVNTCPRVPQITDESDRYGIMYVLEGSSLGGQVLTKHFHEKFNLSEGIRYFSGYGPETISMWRSFQADLLTFSESKYCDRARVIASANNTFRLLNDWLIDQV